MLDEVSTLSMSENNELTLTVNWLRVYSQNELAHTRQEFAVDLIHLFKNLIDLFRKNKNRTSSTYGWYVSLQIYIDEFFYDTIKDEDLKETTIYFLKPEKFKVNSLWSIKISKLLYDVDYEDTFTQMK